MSARVCDAHFVEGENVPSLRTSGDAGAAASRQGDVQAMEVEVNQSSDADMDVDDPAKKVEKNRPLIVERIRQLEVSAENVAAAKDVDVSAAAKDVNAADGKDDDDVVGEDVDVSDTVDDVSAKDVDVAAVHPKKALQLKAQVDTLEKELSNVLKMQRAEQRSSDAKDYEIARLREQAQVLIKNEQTLKDELVRMRKVAKNRGDMLRRVRESKEDVKANPSDAAVKSTGWNFYFMY